MVVADLGTSEQLFAQDLSHSVRLRSLIGRNLAEIEGSLSSGAAAKATPFAVSCSPSESPSENSCSLQKGSDANRSSADPAAPFQTPVRSNEATQQTQTLLKSIFSQRQSRVFHKEATTLLYRAPEQLFRLPKGYGEKVDIWSLGCVFLELNFGAPFFCSVKSAEKLMSSLCVLMGEKAFKGWPELWNSPDVQRLNKTWKYESFGDYLKESGFDELTIDFVKRMMELDPSKRASAKELLNHGFFEGMSESEGAQEFPVIERESHDFSVKVEQAKRKENKIGNLGEEMFDPLRKREKMTA